MSRRTFNIAVARIKRWRNRAHLSNVGDTVKMVADEVVTIAAAQLYRAVIADGVAVARRSIDIAYSPKTNCMASLIRLAEHVAESVHIHGVPAFTAAVDAELGRPVVGA